MPRFQVLYAEDEFTNRKLVEVQLSKHGISCDPAVDGLQALKKIRQNEYDLVILDQYMPGLNGDTVALEIKKLFPQMRLLAITSDDSEIDRLFEIGFLEVFIKPLRGTEYIKTIQKYLLTKE